MDYQTRYEDLSRVLEDLIERNRTTPVVVEGERDRRALEALGVRGEIRVVNRGTSLFRLCEELGREGRGAIILTDWDARGGRLARQLRPNLSSTAGKGQKPVRKAATETIGRNDPCPCGSGRKYKHCHGRPGAEPLPAAKAVAGKR